MNAMLSFDPQVYTILVQMFIAFGQGAGTMRVSDEAINTATQTYQKRIPAQANNWESIQLQALYVAHALGRLAAHLAVHEGRDTILPKDIESASDKLKPMIPCPFCLELYRR